MSTHDLKTWPVFFEAIASGAKTFEIRKDDRPYFVGDVLNLQEWDPLTGRYTGRVAVRDVTYIARPSDGPIIGRVVADGFCIMGIRP